MSAAIDRARADLADGRLWKARDRLRGALVARADDELLGLLGEVYLAMGDLPEAGSVWFGCERAGPDVERAEAAWRERHGNDPLQLWLSLPPQVRKAGRSGVAELREAAVGRAAVRRRARASVPGDLQRGEGPGWAIAILTLVTAVTVCVLVGAWTIVAWAIH